MEIPVLTSLLLTLTVDGPARLPPFLGRAGRAVLLKLVASDSPDLAERLHAPNERRPYTCSTIWGAPSRDGKLVPNPDHKLHLRYTGLTAEISAQLCRLAEDPPPSIDVEGVNLRIRQTTLDSEAHSWAGQTTYEEVADDYLLAGARPSNRVRLQFASPTAFRSGGMVVPLPLPGLVYGSLVETWNTFSPVAVSEDVRRFAEECMAISRYRLSTRAVSGKGQSVQIGFVGRCQYTALRRDRYWLGVIQLLTDYAFYAGVGYQTTGGMGQVRRATT